MQAARPEFSFLAGGGELAGLIAGFDWSRTSLGPLTHWPAHVRVATSLMLQSKVPMVMLWGESGVMIYNDAYALFAAQRHPALLGSRVREGWPEVAEFNDKVMKTGLAGGTLNLSDQELVLHRNNRAEQVWMNLDYSPLLDSDGRPVGVMAIVVDTTDKVLALRQASGERERMARLFDQAPSFMAMLRGPSHMIELANPKYLQLIGHRPVVGKTVAQALPDAVAQGYLDLLEKVYASGEAFVAKSAKYDVQLEPGGPANTRYVDFVFQPVRNAAGEVDGIFVEGVDTTDRVLAQVKRETLVLLADRLGAGRTPGDVGYAASEILGETLEVSRVGYGSVDDEAETLHVERDWCAPEVESLAGVTKLRDYGSFIDSLKRGEFICIEDVRTDPRTAPAAGALESKSARSFVNVPVMEHDRLVAVFFVNHAHARQWSADELAFIREVGQRTRVTVERVRAATALRESEARLREANETLEAKVRERTRALMDVEAQFRQAQKMEAIGQLTGGIAHDFNNLLHSMGMSLEILKRHLQAGRIEGWERYVAMSQDSVKRAAALTHRLLAFSRRQTLDPKPTDVVALLGGLDSLVRGTVGPAIAVETRLAPGLWMATVDGPQLENAVLNLCINARDAMRPGGGRLAIDAANEHLDSAAASSLQVPPGDYIQVCVADTGCGMSEDVLARAFDPFYTTKPLGQGTGLGLSMVYGFVRQSGGQVRIDSQVGEGTRVRMYLPRSRAEGTREEREPAAPADMAQQGEVVVIVEDEAPTREMLREELQGAGYQVIALANGAQALMVLQSDQKVDMLITDVGLPGGLNGRQVADAARVRRPGLKVLFITGYADADAVGNAQLPAGMAVVTKPFVFENLLKAMAGLASA